MNRNSANKAMAIRLVLENGQIIWLFGLIFSTVKKITMDLVALGVALLYDPVFAFLCVPLFAAHPSNQARTTILIAAALAALYSYRSSDRSRVVPADMALGQTRAETGGRCLMVALRIVLVLSILMYLAGVNPGPPRAVNLGQLLAK